MQQQVTALAAVVVVQVRRVLTVRRRKVEQAATAYPTLITMSRLRTVAVVVAAQVAAVPVAQVAQVAVVQVR